MTGYVHPSYAQSLSDLGIPYELPRSQGWILKRPIPNSNHHDAMGCYPIFACRNWPLLKTDLDELGDGLICLSIVADPFGEYDESYLHSCFPDVVIPFKQHFVADLSRAPETFVSPHHRRNARRALSDLQVEKCDKPEDFLDDWIALYKALVLRHTIKGFATFSREAFAQQLRVPGIVAFRAVYNDATVGMLLWYVQDKRAYYHLGAYVPLGYELRASFALFDQAIRHFAERDIEWLILGAGAGTDSTVYSGLDRFKEGWSTGTRTVYFCGRIFDHQEYAKITNAANRPPSHYFPAYRAGESG